MKLNFCLGFVVLFLVATSCQQKNTASVSSTAVQGTHIVTTITPTVISKSRAVTTVTSNTSVHKTSTPIPIPEPSVTPWPDLVENGVLWILQDNPRSYITIDLEKKTIKRKAETLRQECEGGLFPNTTQPLCYDPLFDNQLYLLNLLTWETNYLPISQPNWYRWSPNGRFIISGQVNQNTGLEDIIRYDMSTQLTQTLITDLNTDDWWLNEFKISTDGQYLVGMKKTTYTQTVENFDGFANGTLSTSGTKIVELITKTTPYQEFDLSQGLHTKYIAWSPVNTQLVQGIVNPSLHGNSPTELYVIDVLNKQSELLAEAGVRASYDVDIPLEKTGFIPSSIWSQNGEHLAVTITSYDENHKATRKLCIINIKNKQQECYLEGYYLITKPAWSPSSKYISFWAKPSKSEAAYLSVFDIDNKEIITLLRKDAVLNIKQIDTMFWR